MASAFVGYRRHYDIALLTGVHLAGISGGPIIKWIARRPVVREMTLMGSDDPLTIKKTKGGKLLGRLYRIANLFIGCSEASLSSYTDAGWRVDRLLHIRLGVDSEEYEPANNIDEKMKLRKLYKLPEEGTLLWVTVASVIPRKGIHRLVKAWEKVCKVLPDVHLIIAGPQPDDNYLLDVQKAAKQAGIAKYVHWLGMVNEVEGLLKAVDGFVFASEQEGGTGTNALLEAMSAGLPCVVMDIPKVIRPVLNRSEIGIVVSAFNEDLLADAVIELSNNPDKRMAMGQAARKEIEAHYSLKQEVAAHAALYHKLVSS
ncbi:MAG: glycosyltransferase family 4 protein [Nitrospira sp.]|nr:glycosyltransferase family 4 protein [Nitrospira sp.]